MKKQNKDKTMREVSKEYEQFIKRHELKHNHLEEFEKTLEKAATTKPKQKQRGSK